MNKKTFAAAIALALVAGSAYAQTEQQSEDITEEVIYSNDKYKVETNRFWSNWFISAGAGGQVYFGNHDKQADFGDRISPALDIAVGKWFTPGIGVRLMYSGLSVKGATQKGALAHSTGSDLPARAAMAIGWRSRSSTTLTSMPMRCSTSRTSSAATTRHVSTTSAHTVVWA